MLRSWAPEDLESAHAYQSDPEVWRYIGDPSRTLDDTRERLERYSGWEREHGYTLWAVVERASGELVGDCGLIPLEGKGPEVELGYRFARAHWGIGYATEAAVAVRDLGSAASPWSASTWTWTRATRHRGTSRASWVRRRSGRRRTRAIRCSASCSSGPASSCRSSGSRSA